MYLLCDVTFMMIHFSGPEIVHLLILCVSIILLLMYVYIAVVCVTAGFASRQHSNVITQRA